MPTLPVTPNTVPSGAKPSGVKPPGGKVPAMPSLAEPADRSPVWEVAAMTAVALFLITACWFVPRPTGDLYVARAGARDLMDGKLGKPKGLAGPGTVVRPDSPAAPLVRVLGWFGVRTGGPDDWSFDEPRPVWMDQNWGTQLLFDLAWRIFGPNGVPGLKALLMLTMAACVALSCRQHKVRWPVCILMAGCAVIGGWAYIDLRPNLILLTLAPMMYWLLIRSRHNPARIWWAVVLMAFWGNMHGSAIFGLGMVGLWAVCQGLPAVVRRQEDWPLRLKWFCILGFFSLLPVVALMGALVLKWDVGERLGEPWYWIPFALPLAGLYLVKYAPQSVREDFRRWWPVLLTPVFSMFLITVVNLFGLENLTHPLIMGSSKEWRGVAEWRPVLPLDPVFYGSTKEFFIAMGLLTFLMAARPLTNELLGRKKNPLSDGLCLVFALGVSMLVAVLAWNNASILSGKVDDLPQRALNTPFGNEMSDLLGIANAVKFAFALIAALSLYTAYRVFLTPSAGRGGFAPPEKTEGSLLLFAVLLVGIVLQMAFESRRFVTLSLGLVAPLLAVQINWFIDLALRVPLMQIVRPAILAGAIALLPAQGLLRKNLPQYYPKNPMFRPFLSTWFDRTTMNEAYLHGGAEFFNLNNIRGNVIEEWRWEGFMHWKCPQLKEWVGGRAQQAYDLRPYMLRMQIWGGFGYSEYKQYAEQVRGTRQGEIENQMYAEMSKAARRLESELQRLNIIFVVGAMDDNDLSILEPLVHGTNHRWVYLYFDRENFILGDSASPEVAKIIDKIVKGEALYPEKMIPGSAAASRAMCMVGQPGKYSAEERRLALEKANREMPSPEFLSHLLQMEGAGEVKLDYLVQYFTTWFQDSGQVHTNPYEDLRVMQVRMQLAGVMTNLAAQNPQLVRNRLEWQQALTELQKRYQEETGRWH